MAQQPLAIDVHPQRQAVLNALAKGESLRSIASWLTPKVSVVSISRWVGRVAAARNFIEVHGAITNSHGKPVSVLETASAMQNADPLLHDAELQRGRREKMMAVAEEKKDIKGFSALDHNQLRDIELRARLTGRFDGPQVKIEIGLSLGPVERSAAAPGQPAEVTSVEWLDAESDSPE